MLSVMDYAFLILVAGAAVWGLAALLIGGILRFDLSHYIDSLVVDVQTDFYSKTSNNLLIVSKKLGEADLGNWSNSLGGILIAIGLIILGFAAAGFVASFLNNSTALFVTAGLILVAFIIEFVFLWLLVDIRNSFHGDAKDNLADKLKKEYELGVKANDFSKFFNALMIAGKCCGSKGYDDFKNMTFKHHANHHNFMHSPACCTKDVWMKISNQALGLEALETCVEKNMYYVDGCYEVFFQEVSDSSGSLIVAMLALLMMWEAAVGGLVVCLLFRADAEADSKKEAATIQQKEDSAEAMKEFTPYSQLSSFRSQDVERIKSTEIW